MAFINSLAAAIFGTAGADEINAQANNGSFSTIYGGLGNDIYIIDATFFGLPTTEDVVIEAAGGGTDTVRLNMYYEDDPGHGNEFFTLADNVENLEANLENNNAIYGNSYTFILKGNSLANKISITSSDSDSNAWLYGMAGNDTLIGGVAGDLLGGGMGADSMVGGDGGDVYYVDNALDKVVESVNQGLDAVDSSVTFTLGANIERLTLLGSTNINGTGNALSNQMYGNYGNNTLNGLAGNDFLRGNDGNDILNGGDGNDELRGQNGNDTQNGGAGNDVLYGNILNSVFIDKLDGGAGDDVYRIYSANDIVADTGVGGNDTVRAFAQLNGDLGTGIENLELLFGTLTGRGNALNNVITGNSYNNSLFGLAGNDLLNGDSGNDILEGGDGNDTLDGGGGNDLMRGGNGNDTYIVDSTSYTAVETTAGAIGGTDTVFSSATTFTLGANIENLTLLGAGAINGTGNTLANLMIGNAGANSIDGGDGADTLNGGAGVDTLVGGAGNDVFIVDETSDVVTELTGVGSGIDLVQSSANTFTLSAEIENLTLTGSGNIEGVGSNLANIITGNSGNNNLYGGYAADTLIGGLGNDVLNGGLDADSMVGGLGNDSYYVDVGGDIIIELAAQGSDTVYANLSFSIASLVNIENLTLLGSVINGTGNALNNVITGNTIANSIDGGAGNDNLIGLGGNDTLIGGLGNDVLNGESDNDSLIGGAGDDSLLGEQGLDTLDGGDGNDVLNGGVGDDLMKGGNGNDTYIIDATGDAAVETTAGALGGTDTVFSTVTTTLGTNLENLTLAGAAASNGTGNTLANVIIGNAGNNSIDGGDGADTLNGGAGFDTLVGGDGNDVYIVDETTDFVTEAALGGIDLVQSSANTFTLSTEVENLTLTGSSNINGFGNSLANIITGNSGNNTLYGAQGNDTIIGGAGNDLLQGGTGVDSMVGGLGDDIYYVDVSTDKVIELAGQGTDRVDASVNFTLAALVNVENLTLTYGALNGTGNALNNAIAGNSNDNLLDGGAGNDSFYGGYGADTLIGGLGNDTLDGGSDIDSMVGGAGNDTYFVTHANDVVIETAGAGTDTLIYELAGAVSLTGSFANIENVILGAAGTHITGNSVSNLLIGNALFNILSGGAGNDTLDGGAGGDNLDGGAGDDVYIVNSTGDVVTEAALGGIDLVQSSANTFTLSTEVENLTLTGSSNINGFGNSLANIITGNSGNNTLYGAQGNDTIIGGAGNDLLQGGTGVDSMVGGLGDDIYYVDVSTDKVIELAGQGADTVNTSISFSLATLAHVENLTLHAGGINATGNALNNTILGNNDANMLDGGAGNDSLSGDGGTDIIIGGLGNDALIGGGANDILTGGAGNDVFWQSNDGSIDTITDFVVGLDSLKLFGFGLNFTGGGNSLAADQFALGDGSTGTVGNDDTRIIYNQTTGDLYYDLNGSNNGGQVQILDFTGIAPALSAADIFG